MRAIGSADGGKKGIADAFGADVMVWGKRITRSYRTDNP
jgi:hypothetical protein